jgi:hypothetical protein
MVGGMQGQVNESRGVGGILRGLLVYVRLAFWALAMAYTSVLLSCPVAQAGLPPAP